MKRLFCCCLLALPVWATTPKLIDGLMFDTLDEFTAHLREPEHRSDRALERVLLNLPPPMPLPVSEANRSLPAPQERVLKLLRSARVFADDGLWQEALLVYRELLQLEPTNISYLERAALAATLAGRYGVADAYFAELLAAMPNHVDYLVAWGGVLLRLNRLSDANAVLARAAALRSNHLMLELYGTIAEVLQGQSASNWSWRYASLNELAEVTQAITDEREDWAGFLGGQNLAEVVSRILGPVPVSALPNYARLLHTARVMIHEQRWSEAVPVLEVLVQYTPGRPMLAMEYARGLQQVDRGVEALEIARSVAEQHPQQADILYALGYLQVYAGDYADAAVSFERALDWAPHRGHYQFALACAWMNAGRKDEAWPLLNRLAATHPDWLAYWLSGEAPYLDVIRQDRRYPELLGP